MTAFASGCIDVTTLELTRDSLAPALTLSLSGLGGRLTGLDGYVSMSPANHPDVISGARCDLALRKSNEDPLVERALPPISVSSPIEIAAALRNGEIVILIDDEDRENEGDLVIAADCVSAEHINFMARYGRGLICLTLTEQRCDELELPLAEQRNTGGRSTNFTASIDAVHGTTTGISAADRAATIRTAIQSSTRPADLMQPGHVFPLMARPGGVLERPGHTEAGCDYAALAGLTPAAVICEIMKDDGEMARLPDLLTFAQEHGLRIGTIADLVAFRQSHL
jgi:3,4-dihydroxy 2-butanone 4-phosphate synthase/GTP cyclohydrolase II